MSKAIIKIGNLKKTKRDNEIYRVYSIKGLSPTLTQFTGGGRQHKILINMEDKKDVLVDFQGKKVAIRKLTQWECLRLMGVPEDKINLAKQSGIKKTNIYKMAGNSIVVHQLAAIFENIFYPPQQSNKQLKLF